MRFTVFSAACLGILLALGAPLRAVGADLTWLLGYRDKGENALVGDPRFVPFLRDGLPPAPLPGWGNEPANKAAEEFLQGVPGYVEVRHGRYFAASGCPAHACVARALLWVDTQSGITVFIATADEVSNNDKPRAPSIILPTRSCT
jgi:hypothetical protein